VAATARSSTEAQHPRDPAPGKIFQQEKASILGDKLINRKRYEELKEWPKIPESQCSIKP
jgi:hypothetical protein